MNFIPSVLFNILLFWFLSLFFFRFLREADDDDPEKMTYEKKMAKKYYDKLFKEYCIADMTLYKVCFVLFVLF